MSGASRGGRELVIRLLGPLEVSKNGQATAIGGPKPRALLAALALEAGHVVSVDALIETLWPGEPPDTAGHAVQVYVSQLRKALGNDAISTKPPGYVLELDPARVDVQSFAQLVNDGREALGAGDPAAASSLLRDALALWRGPALADFTYEPFAQADIGRLEELRAVALEERIEADLGLGRHAELVSELEALVETQPLRERPRGQLMLALYRSGRQADALAAYREARETLVEELGIEPGPELRKLEAAILRQDESLLPPEGASAPAMQFRRLVTILFVDVVESMALAEALDAEALGSVLSGYFETVSEALTRHGGTVEKFAGDAVMAVFGIPVSHEDDALRAARASVDIRTAVGVLNERLVERHGVGLGIRIGIEAGEVVTTPTDTRQRLVTGEAVGIASRLEQAAAENEIVVGELAGRLIDHAARLEPLRELELKGKREPVRAFRLLELAAVAPAFARRLDAPLVGRTSELAALRKLLKTAIADSRAGVAVVVGPPGVGKSRLAAELARRAKGVTALWGRCLSYGEGITYWPLREVVEAAPESDERAAVLAAFDADTPPPAPEIAWRFRQFCERIARERPLLLVLDDVHWAESTLLELVEHLAEKADGPVLVVCLAREELLEDRPAFLADSEIAERLLLDTLSADDTDALLESLGGSVLETDQRRRIVETAEGNPLFLEQLLALALEGGLAERPLPETIQSLLAARLDRLGPGERAVLERAAVVGKEFSAEHVATLLEPDAAATADAHLRALSDRGFVRPGGGQGFGFRHVLVQQSVYRAAPKRLRAELHERFADHLDREAEEIPELDEFLGYHLEQAYLLRTDLGESDVRTAQLAEAAGRRLGAAGMRALKRGDIPATVSLLERAVPLVPPENEARYELMCELGVAQLAAGDTDAAAATAAEAVSGAARAGHRAAELRARVEAGYVRLLSEPEGAAGDLLAAAEDALPTLEALDNDRSLARTWLLIGYVRGGVHGNHAAWQEAEERALVYYRRTSFPPATCLGQIAAATYWGPTPVQPAIEQCARLLGDEGIGHAGRAAVLPYFGGLHAQGGQFGRARDLVAEAEHLYDELGARAASMIHCGTVRADLELLAGEAAAAERTLREQCEFFEQIHDRSHLAVRAAKLSEALYRQGLLDEAAHWAGLARANAASDDQSVQLTLVPVEAKLLARRGAVSEAQELCEGIVRLADSTDGLNRIAAVRLACAEVMGIAGLLDEASHMLDEAIELFERKGNVVGASAARDHLGHVIPA
jgi:DNA-binding SARP family transcriptional activator/tetratricopeptide (TPR) repeat protein